MRLLSSLLMLSGVVRAAATPIDENRLVDLSHAFDEKTIYWPTAKPFEWRKQAWGQSPGGYWYASGSFAASDHLGTHIDSPIHFAEGQATTDAIPLSQLTGPAVLIDIGRQSAGNPDYQLSAADLLAWEKRHGRVPAGSIVLVRTGWSAFWPDRRRYMGDDAPGDTKNLHFPGISAGAAKLLVDRKVDGVGIDTASIDHGPSSDFQTHRILMRSGIYGLENLTGLDRLPATGATVVALPMKIRNGTGGPVRVMAILP